MSTITADAIVKARIDRATKINATQALEAMGLTISDAIRILLMRIADEKKMPFEVKVPTPALSNAIDEVRSGKAHKFKTVNEAIDHLEI